MDGRASSGPNILLGVCGSVAAVKVPLLVRGLAGLGSVRVVPTEHALHFFRESDLDGPPLFKDADEWATWSKLGDPVLHIELRKWADVFVIAPLDANTLAKMSCGLSDNLLSCVARAWDFHKPLLVAPAMNTAMYEHPITAQQLGTLTGWGVTVIPTVCKRLACGDEGNGAMAEWESIVQAVAKVLP